MKIRMLTEQGSNEFRAWLETRKTGELPPSDFIDGEKTAPIGKDFIIDEDMTFSTRYDFGRYMTDTIGLAEVRNLLAQKNDGVWDWLTIVYFSQFGKKVSKFWHYVVTRRGHAGSLAYRHLVRTSVEMYWRHKESSVVMLSTDLSTWGDMSEQLTSRQNVAYHRACINTANTLYFDNGKLRRGSAGRVPPKAKRTLGDRRGRGGVARLALAVRRLCRTYDTHVIETSQMIELLPKEFSSFVKTTELSHQ